MDITLIKKRLRYKKSSQPITRNRDLSRIQRLADAIQVRFGIEKVEQIKLKHCKYLLTWLEQHYAGATQQDYLRSMTTMISALDKGEWLGHLGLNKTASNGGRPKKVSTVRSKSRLYLEP